MVNIDTVYQTVQALANKEQRGYITPQEFNLFANQAQQDIFQQYFYDLNAFRLQRPEGHEIGDSVSLIRDKIRNTSGVTYNPNTPVLSGTNLPPGYDHYGRIFAHIGNVRKTLRLIEPEEIENLRGSRWHLASFDEYVFFDDGFRKIQVWSGAGQITTGITCETMTGKPGLVYWNYVVVNEKPTYNPINTEHFDLDASEQTDLVINILKLAGISIEDPQLYSMAGQEGQLNLQQENK